MPFLGVVTVTRHLCLSNIKPAISNSELHYQKFYVHFLQEKGIPVFQLVLYMAARRFVHVTYSSSGISGKWGCVYILLPTITRQRPAEDLYGSLAPSHFATGCLESPSHKYSYSEQVSALRAPASSLPWPARLGTSLLLLRWAPCASPTAAALASEK